MIDVIKLTQQLIAQASITPDDAECQAILSQLLKNIGFEVNSMPCENVNNLWACYGDKAPLFVFAGHTDVVPAGNLQHWKYDPFTPILQDGKLYGRGSADMKGGLAAMLAATAQFLKQSTTLNGSIGS